MTDNSQEADVRPAALFVGCCGAACHSTPGSIKLYHSVLPAFVSRTSQTAMALL